MSRRTAILFAAAIINVVLLSTAILTSPPSKADAVAYLVNVTVRPGYNFASPDHALQYGHSICAKVVDGRHYADLINDLKADFRTSDDYQAAYLINQAVNELCPAAIWQLRNSAAGYTGGKA